MNVTTLINRISAAVTHSLNTRGTTPPANDPAAQTQRTGAGLRSWFENTAFAAGYSSDGKNTLFLAISEPRADGGGRTYHTVGLTKKLHHATLFANKRRIHLAKERLPLASNDRQSLEYLSKAFPVPVFAKPAPPKAGIDTFGVWEGGCR